MEPGYERSLSDLTKADIEKAFEKARENVNIPGIKLVLITEEYFDKALQLCREHFITEEPIEKALGVKWSDAAEAFWLSALKLNMSIMFIDEDSEEAIAFRITNITRSEPILDIDVFQSEPMTMLLVQFIRHCVGKADAFRHYGTKETIHFLGLVVAEKYRRRGLGTQIFRAAIDMTRHLGIHPLYITGEGTSNYSKKIYECAGFDILYEKSYNTWEHDGRFPIQNTGQHKSMKVYGLRVSTKD